MNERTRTAAARGTLDHALLRIEHLLYALVEVMSAALTGLDDDSEDVDDPLVTSDELPWPERAEPAESGVVACTRQVG